MDILGLIKHLGEQLVGGGSHAVPAKNNAIVDRLPGIPPSQLKPMPMLPDMAAAKFQPAQYIDPQTHQKMPLGQAPAGFQPYVPQGQDPKNFGYAPDITYNPNMTTNIPWSTHYANPNWDASRGGAPQPSMNIVDYLKNPRRR